MKTGSKPVVEGRLRRVAFKVLSIVFIVDLSICREFDVIKNEGKF